MEEQQTILELYPGLMPTIVCAFGAIIAFNYLRLQPESPRGPFAICVGLFFSILNQATILFDQVEIPIQYAIAVELSILAVSAVFMAIGSIQLKGKNLGVGTAFLISLLIIGYVVNILFIDRAPKMINVVRVGLPCFSFLVMGYSFIFKKASHSSSGFTFTGWLCFFGAFFYFLQFFEVGRGLMDVWYVLPFIYAGFVFGAMLMANNVMSLQCENYKAEAESTAERLRLIIQSSPFPITISRLKDDQLILINNKAARLFGIDQQRAQSHRMIDYFADKAKRNELINHLNSKPVVDDFEVLIKGHGSGDPFWMLLSAQVINFEYELALYCAFQNITGRKEKEQQLFDQATRDPLTGVFNRRQFQDIAGKEIHRCNRYGSSFCIIMVDADHFKKVNDTYGHATGDEVLKALSACCVDVLRESDSVFRFGGEEFVLLLPEITLEQAYNVAERLRIKISELKVQGEEPDTIVMFTVSMGIAESSEADTPDDLVKLADEALYEAKETGRNKVVISPRRRSLDQNYHAEVKHTVPLPPAVSNDEDLPIDDEDLNPVGDNQSFVPTIQMEKNIPKGPTLNLGSIEAPVPNDELPIEVIEPDLEPDLEPISEPILEPELEPALEPEIMPQENVDSTVSFEVPKSPFSYNEKTNLEEETQDSFADTLPPPPNFSSDDEFPDNLATDDNYDSGEYSENYEADLTDNQNFDSEAFDDGEFNEADIEEEGEPELETFDEPEVDAIDDWEAESFDNQEPGDFAEPELEAYAEPELETESEPGLENVENNVIAPAPLAPPMPPPIPQASIVPPAHETKTLIKKVKIIKKIAVPVAGVHHSVPPPVEGKTIIKKVVKIIKRPVGSPPPIKKPPPL